MKILFLGDASNYHASMAHALRGMGHDVTVASAGSGWMKTRRDIDISRPFAGRIGGALLYARMLTVLAPRLRGYDAVHLVAPTFAHLRPSRLLKIFRRLRQGNGAVYLTYLGTDSTYVKSLTGANPPLEYSEWSIAGRPTAYSLSPQAQKEQWLDPALAEYTDAVFEGVDGVATALYEYQKVLERERPAIRSVYAGIPVCLDMLPEPDFTPQATLHTLYAAHKGREDEKGSRYILELLRRFGAEHPGRIRLVAPPNMPYQEFVSTLGTMQLVADQLYSYTPATTALLAMACGAVPLSGGEDAFYDFIGERELRPVINLRPGEDEANYRTLCATLTDSGRFEDMRRQARRFVEKHNDANIVARRFVTLYR